MSSDSELLVGLSVEELEALADSLLAPAAPGTPGRPADPPEREAAFSRRGARIGLPVAKG